MKLVLHHGLKLQYHKRICALETSSDMTDEILAKFETVALHTKLPKLVTNMDKNCSFGLWMAAPLWMACPTRVDKRIANVKSDSPKMCLVRVHHAHAWQAEKDFLFMPQFTAFLESCLYDSTLENYS